MKKILAPAGAMLVGVLFIGFLIGLTAAQPQLDATAQLQMLKDYQTQLDSNKGQLKLASNTVRFPWSTRDVSGPEHHRSDFMQHSTPVKEEIDLNASHSDAQVEDLTAMNAVKQRDIVYDEPQSDTPNSLDVRVGKGDGEKGWAGKLTEGDSLEKYVDNAVDSGMNNGRHDGGASADGQPQENYMNIDVSGITVSAINTVEGGSATATSNIVIKPVQIINCPCEAEEKLK
jgi:hypothetical protein